MCATPAIARTYRQKRCSVKPQIGYAGEIATPTPIPLRALADTLEQAAALDSPAKAIGKALRGAISPGAAKDAISGTWLGHALHPPLTDVVIGALLSATALDLAGADGADGLIGIGVAAAIPTALTGANDWADSEIADDAVRRVGLVHASANTGALVLYGASVAARRSGARGRARALALAGAAVMTVSGYLGGHMSYTRGVGPNQTAFDAGPEDWTAVTGVTALADGEPVAGVAADTPVLLVRHGDGIHAIHDRCSHRGCPLSDGELEGHVVTCSCHGSQFDVRDGSVLRGPATAGQPAFDARESGGGVEVRLKSR